MSLPEVFNEIFGSVELPIQFDSLEEFGKAMDLLKRSTGASYCIRSTKPNIQNAKYRIYECVKSGLPRAPRVSTQMLRRRQSSKIGCHSKINVSRLANDRFVVVRVNLEHNHSVCVNLGKYDPSQRRLNADELAVVTPWLLNNTPSYNICNYVRTQMGKFITTKDVCNMRSKLMAGRCTSGYLGQLQVQYNQSGRCAMESDAEGNVTHFIFMTNEQLELSRRFPHFMGIDSTFKTCREQYNLFVLVVVDGCGMGLPVCFGWLRNETTESISLFVQRFLEFTNYPNILAIMMDDSAATQAALRQHLPQAHQFLCRVHILNNVKKRHPGELFMKWFHVAMNTRRRGRYLLALAVMNVVNEQLYQEYIRPRLIDRAAMWTSMESPAVPTFGRRCNNFVEATHWSIKRHNLSGIICLWQAIERTKDVFHHILLNRQARLVTASRGITRIPNHPELDGLCSLLVPRAVELMKENLRQNQAFTTTNAGTHTTVADGIRLYTVSAETWRCDCPFSTDFLLPCRHALYVRQERGFALGNLNFVP